MGFGRSVFISHGVDSMVSEGPLTLVVVDGHH